MDTLFKPGDLARRIDQPSIIIQVERTETDTDGLEYVEGHTAAGKLSMGLSWFYEALDDWENLVWQCRAGERVG